jgi:hypothetical protein
MGRVWTIEQRQKQADRIRSQKPWLKSTGPRTARGRLASSRNATRHGCYSAEFKMISVYLKMQKHYIDTLRFMLKHDLFIDETPFEISGNELNENATKSIQNDTNGCVKTMVKNGVFSNRHCEERSDEAIQNDYYTLHGLPRFALNDNNIKPPYPHLHKNNSKKNFVILCVFVVKGLPDSQQKARHFWRTLKKIADIPKDSFMQPSILSKNLRQPIPLAGGQ